MSFYKFVFKTMQYTKMYTHMTCSFPHIECIQIFSNCLIALYHILIKHLINQLSNYLVGKNYYLQYNKYNHAKM